LRSVALGGGSQQWAYSIRAGVSRSNGGEPVKHSYSTQVKEYTVLLASAGSKRIPLATGNQRGSSDTGIPLEKGTGDSDVAEESAAVVCRDEDPLRREIAREDAQGECGVECAGHWR